MINGEVGSFLIDNGGRGLLVLPRVTVYTFTLTCRIECLVEV